MNDVSPQSSVASPANTAGIMLLGVHLLESHFAVHPRVGLFKKVLPPPLAIDYDWTTREAEEDFAEEQKVLLSRLRLKLIGRPGPRLEPPFELITTFQGVYRFTTSAEVDIEQFAGTAAPAHIYPYIREHVAAMTGRSLLPALHLPPVNIKRLLQTKIRRRPVILQVELAPLFPEHVS